MKLFKRKREERELYPFVQKLLLGIHRKLLRFAVYLQQKTNHYSRRRRKIILLMFCLAFLFESIFLITHSLRINTASYTVTPIKFIRLNNKVFRPVFTRTDFKRIQRFKRYIDSNTILRDSLLMHRHGLIDTLKY
jgi:hypothetical protein